MSVQLLYAIIIQEFLMRAACGIMTIIQRAGAIMIILQLPNRPAGES